MQNQLHIVINASIKSGGEGLAAFRYAESISQAGCKVTLISQSFSGINKSDVGNFPLFLSILIPPSNFLLYGFISHYLFIKKICSNSNFDLIHFHGMWSPLLVIASLISKRMNIPLIISPHGCLEPWALSHKKFKKTLALASYQGLVLRSASLFIATADREMESIRRLGYRQPIAIVPNGIDIPSQSLRDMNSYSKVILFISRIHPVKGLLDLVDAWSKVRLPGWSIVIAGEGDKSHADEVKAMIRSKGIESDFEFTGFVEGRRKQALLDGAAVFILPTHSENFGIVIAEALANRVPVITTTAAPWGDLVSYNCGWWVYPESSYIANALMEAMQCSANDLQAMGQRGYDLVVKKYSWSQIGFTAIEVTGWLLGKLKTRPVNVHITSLHK